MQKLKPHDEFPYFVISFLSLFFAHVIAQTIYKRIFIGDKHHGSVSMVKNSAFARNREKAKLEEDVNVDYQKIAKLREEFALLTRPKTPFQPLAQQTHHEQR